jgi:hypothetical protein
MNTSKIKIVLMCATTQTRSEIDFSISNSLVVINVYILRIVNAT